MLEVQARLNIRKRSLWSDAIIKNDLLHVYQEREQGSFHLFFTVLKLGYFSLQDLVALSSLSWNVYAMSLLVERFYFKDFFSPLSFDMITFQMISAIVHTIVCIDGKDMYEVEIPDSTLRYLLFPSRRSFPIHMKKSGMFLKNGQRNWLCCRESLENKRSFIQFEMKENRIEGVRFTKNGSFVQYFVDTMFPNQVYIPLGSRASEFSKLFYPFTKY